MRLNSTNLKQVGGGKIVKQGDSASLFEYRLLDEDHKPVDELNGTEAKITLYTASGKVSIDTTVTNSGITFKLAKPLPIGLYTVEVVAGGYVFPSDQSVRLEVTQSSEKYETLQELQTTRATLSAEIASYLASHPIDVSELITAHLAEHPVQAYDDKPLKDDLSALSGRMDNLSNYDDSGLRNEIKSVSERVSGLHNYDDEELKGRVTTLEGKQSSYALKSEIPQAVNLAPLTNRVKALEDKPDIDLSEYAKKSEIPSGGGTVDLEPYLKTETAYSLFPTYATLQSQMTNNIKDKHLELGLDALIDTKLQNGGDPFITTHQAQTTYATIEKLKALEKMIDSLDSRLKRIEANQL